MSDQRISMESVIQTAIDSALKELHTCLPAVITKITGQTIEAQPTIKRKIKNELVNLPLLVDVPLRYMKSSGYSISFPMSVGDHVLIIFAERSIDTWLLSGNIQSPSDIRRHSLSDGFAIPMMYPETDTIPDFDASNLTIKANNGTSTITVSEAGTVSIESVGATTIESQTQISMIAPIIDMTASASISMTAPAITVTGATAVSLLGAVVSITAPIISTIGVFTNVGVLAATDFQTTLPGAVIPSLAAHIHDDPPAYKDSLNGGVTGKSNVPFYP